MTIPNLWLNGLQITGNADDLAPVLANVQIDWGSDTDIEHQSAANFSFTVWFKDGSNTMPGFQRGAEIEITYDSVTVAAGRIRSAQTNIQDNGLFITAQCTEHVADLAGMFQSTDWIFETSSVRWQTLKNAFAEDGWTLEPATRRRRFGEANSFFHSIQLETLLDRYLAADGSLTRWDASRREDGQLIRAVNTGQRGASSAPNQLSYYGPEWRVEYTVDVNTNVITYIEAENVELGNWSLEAGTVVNSVKLSTQKTTVQDGEQVTELVDSNYSDKTSIKALGLGSIEVTASATDTEPNWQQQLAESWFRYDAGWILDEAVIVDSNAITLKRMKRLLSNNARSKNLVIIRRLFSFMPEDTASNLRASLIGGTYEWTGEKWDLSLRLGRNQVFSASNQYTFTDIRNHLLTVISQGRADTIGHEITFADFKQISKD